MLMKVLTADKSPQSFPKTLAAEWRTVITPELGFVLSLERVGLLIHPDVFIDLCYNAGFPRSAELWDPGGILKPSALNPHLGPTGSESMCWTLGPWEFNKVHDDFHAQ